MSNKTVFVPVDPEGFGCGLLLGLIIRYWREILVAGVILFGCFFGAMFLDSLSQARTANASATEMAQWSTSMANATETVRVAISTAEASPPTRLNVGDTWSGQGLTIRVSNPLINPECHGAFGFDLFIEDTTGLSELTYVDANAPSIIVKESTGHVYSSQNTDEVWYKFLGTTTTEWYSSAGSPDSCYDIDDKSGNPLSELIFATQRRLELAISVIKRSNQFNEYYGHLDPNTQWVSIQLPQIIPIRNVEWIVPISGMSFESSEPIATEAPVEPAATEAPVYSDVISFIYPVDGQTLDYEGAYLFKVTPVEGADGYLWGFFQNGDMIWENLRDEGVMLGVEYGIYEGTLAHSKFEPGYVEVWVRASVYGEWTEATVITIYLEP